jgi:N-succinyldiaminopimelate aminotransferase
VVDNRAQYRAKFAEVTPLLEPVLDVRLPDASFYLWAGVPGWAGDDRLRPRPAGSIQCHGSAGQLSWRATPAAPTPAAGRIRMALVAETAECVEAAERIVRFVQDGRRTDPSPRFPCPIFHPRLSP